MRIILFLIIASSAFAQTSKDDSKYERERLFDKPNPKSLKSSDIKNNKEVFLNEQSLLMEETADGLYADDYYTANDNNNFFLSYQFSSDYEDTNKVTSLEIGYQYKLSGFTDMWFTTTLKRTIAKYDAIAEELDSSSDPDADGNVTRFDSQQSFSTIGFGVGYRFRALTDLIKNDRFFETCYALLNYNAHLDNKTATKYNGFGMNMDYGLHYRSSNTFHYGFKLSYNVIPVVREAKDDEKKQDRSLVFGWTALGFEVGYYY
jgi:hypothetical protein